MASGDADDQLSVAWNRIPDWIEALVWSMATVGWLWLSLFVADADFAAMSPSKGGGIWELALSLVGVGGVRVALSIAAYLAGCAAVGAAWRLATAHLPLIAGTDGVDLHPSFYPHKLAWREVGGVCIAGGGTGQYIRFDVERSFWTPGLPWPRNHVRIRMAFLRNMRAEELLAELQSLQKAGSIT